MKRIILITLLTAIACTFIFIPLASCTNEAITLNQRSDNAASYETDKNTINGYKIGDSDVVIPFQKKSADILNELGLFCGTENGYELDRAVSRAEAITMVLRMIGEEKEAKTAGMVRTFSDVAASNWAFSNIGYAAMRGYINGTSETTFEPARNVTGQEFVKMLLCAMGHEGVTIENAYDQGVNHALLVNNYAKLAVSSRGYQLNRNDIVNICYLSLLAKTPDGKRLQDVLVEKGVVNKQHLNTLTVSDDSMPAQNESFTWKLNGLMPKYKNYMFSPFSVKMAFAMAAVGAEGETKDEILRTLGIEDLDKFNEFAKRIIKEYSENQDVKLSIANSVWVNKDYNENAEFSNQFETIVRNYYSAESEVVDNLNAVQRINDWVNDKTNEKIPEIIDSSNFLACLINAIYFKGEWAEQFQKNATKNDMFTDRNGGKTEIDFMNMTGNFDYYKDSDVQMIKLPYKDGKTSMYIAIPDGRDIELDKYINKMQSKRVKISMPKFKTEFDVELNDMLMQLGIKLAFSGKANFTSMFTRISNAYISKAIHKTYINVDENGTEAAAVTAILMKCTSIMVDEPIVFKADRPFTYFIRDDVNGEILFMGEYAYTE